MKKHVPTQEESEQSLNAHVVNKALDARRAYRRDVEQGDLSALLKDLKFVRFPVSVAFDLEPLKSGELAFPHQKTDSPSDGFVLYIHPGFKNKPQVHSLIIAYYLVVINYGEIVTNEHAEIFGSTLLGMNREEYYQKLCHLADSTVAKNDSVGCQSSGCHTEGCRN